MATELPTPFHTIDHPHLQIRATTHPSLPRLLRRHVIASGIVRDGFVDEGGESLFGQAVTLGEIDGAAGAGFAFGAEQPGGVSQLRAAGLR